MDAAEALEAAGINAVEYVPERVSPPIAIIKAGAPYVEQGQTFTEFQVRLDVRIVAGTATNEVATSALDQLISDAIIALGDWTIELVSEPEMLLVNNAQYLSARLSITTNIQITGGN